MTRIKYPYKELRVDLPETKAGDWTIERFTVSKEDAEFSALRAAISFGDRGRPVPAGKYTRLKRGGTVVMSDTPSEMDDFIYPMYFAKLGKVHFNGLGLGVTLNALFQMDETKEIVVVEKSKDVIDLVGDYYLAKAKKNGVSLTIYNADALTWKWPKETRYTWVWHDIWDHICEDNIPEMTKLKRRFGQITDGQDCWCEDQCRRNR